MPSSYRFAFLLIMVFAPSQTAFRTATVTLMTLIAPDEMRSRVMSLMRYSMGGVVLFSLVVGWFAGVTSVSIALTVMGLLGIGLGIVFWVFSHRYASWTHNRMSTSNTTGERQSGLSARAQPRFSIRIPRLQTFDSFAYSNYRYLWIGNFFSNNAQWLQLLTVGWLVRYLTVHSSTSTLFVVTVGGMSCCRA